MRRYTFKNKTLQFLREALPLLPCCQTLERKTNKTVSKNLGELKIIELGKCQVAAINTIMIAIALPV